MIVKHLALMLLIAGLTTCTAPVESRSDGDLVPQQDVAVVTFLSGIDTQTGTLILDAASWQSAWGSIYANYAQKPALPAINFDSTVVILAAAGTTPTQLYSFQIKEVRVSGESLHVRVVGVWPTCGSLPVITAPVHVVRVPRVATEAQFTFVRTGRCS